MWLVDEDYDVVTRLVHVSHFSVVEVAANHATVKPLYVSASV